MKYAMFAFLFCLTLLPLHAADEPLIPAALDMALPKIHPGMTLEEVEAILAPVYPAVKVEPGGRYKQNGTYFIFNLDGRFRLGIGAIPRNGKDTVDDPIYMSIQNPASGRRLVLRIDELEAVSTSE